MEKVGETFGQAGMLTRPEYQEFPTRKTRSLSSNCSEFERQLDKLNKAEMLPIDSSASVLVTNSDMKNIHLRSSMTPKIDKISKSIAQK